MADVISDEAQGTLQEVLQRMGAAAPMPPTWPYEVDPLTDAERLSWLETGANGLGLAPSAERLAAYVASSLRGRGLAGTIEGFGVELGPLSEGSVWFIGLAMTAGAETRVEGELRPEDIAKFVPVLGQVYLAAKSLYDAVGLGVDADRARARVHEFLLYLRRHPDALKRSTVAWSDTQIRILKKNATARTDVLPSTDPRPAVAPASDDQLRNAARAVVDGLAPGAIAMRVAAYIALSTVGRGAAAELGVLTVDQAWRVALAFGANVQAYTWDFLTRQRVWSDVAPDFSRNIPNRLPPPRTSPPAGAPTVPLAPWVIGGLVLTFGLGVALFL